MKTLAELLTEKKNKAEQGDWYPASNGKEVPFITRSGRKLLYCWQPSTGNHAYLDCDTDTILTSDEASLYLNLY